MTCQDDTPKMLNYQPFNVTDPIIKSIPERINALGYAFLHPIAVDKSTKMWYYYVVE